MDVATQTRSPISDASFTGTWSEAAGSRYTFVDDYPDAIGADYLRHGTTAGVGLLNFSDFTIPAGSTGISVQVRYYDRKNASQNCNLAGRIQIGGTGYAASSHSPSNGTWVAREDNWANNPATGSAWTVDQVNGIGANSLDAQAGWVSTDANPTIDVSSIEVQVTYTPPPPPSGSGTAIGVGNGAAAGYRLSAASGQALGVGDGSAAGYAQSRGAGPASAIASASAAGYVQSRGSGVAVGVGGGAAAGYTGSEGEGTAAAVGVGSAAGWALAAGSGIAAGIGIGLGTGEAPGESPPAEGSGVASTVGGGQGAAYVLASGSGVGSGIASGFGAGVASRRRPHGRLFMGA